MVLPLSLVVSICKDLRDDITWCSRFVASSFPSIDIISATEGPSWNWWKMIIRKLNLSVKSQRILHPTQKLSPFNYLLLIFSRSRLFSFMHKCFTYIGCTFEKCGQMDRVISWNHPKLCFTGFLLLFELITHILLYCQHCKLSVEAEQKNTGVKTGQ